MFQSRSFQIGHSRLSRTSSLKLKERKTLKCLKGMIENKIRDKNKIATASFLYTKVFFVLVLFVIITNNYYLISSLLRNVMVHFYSKQLCVNQLIK